MSWISVKENLPENEKEVVVVMDAGRIVKSPHHPGYGSKNWIEKSHRIKNLPVFLTELVQAGNVTHWMNIEDWNDKIALPK